MAEVTASQPETTFARLQREAAAHKAAARQQDKKMDNLSVASGVVAGLGGALIGLALYTTPSLAEHTVPETPIEWVEVGAEAILLAAEAALLAKTLQANRSLNQSEAQASRALMQAAEIPPYQR